MQSLFYLTFLISMAKSGVLIAIGVLLINYFETFMAFIIRKPVPDGLIEQHKHAAFLNLIKWIGILIIVIAIGLIIFAAINLKTSLNPPTNSINFKSLDDMINQFR